MALNTVSQFADQTRLLARLAIAIRKNQKVSFLIGSALTAPDTTLGGRGVPSVANLVKRIEHMFKDTDEHSLFLEEIARSQSDAEKYQNSMQLLLDCQGQEELNKVIREAVLEARKSPGLSTLTEEDYNQLELETNGWALRPGIEALGELIALYPKIFSEPTLTSNFDPLAEVSIRNAGGSSQSVFLSGDGLFDNIAGDHAHRVVHFHGYWRGSDTLHTPHQLRRERPKLEGCLRDLLKKVFLVVIGYGGWDDVFTRALLRIIAEERSNISVLWCFYTDNDQSILANERFMASIQPALGQRLVVYKGIDCHTLLPQLLQKVKDDQIQKAKEPALRAAEDVANFSNSDKQIEPKSAIPANEQDLLCDTPPSIQTWVGREDELARLRESNAKVIAITGIGGQGKSTIAAKYLNSSMESKKYAHWDWRDLREEPNTAQKQLMSIICRVTNGSITPGMLTGENSESLIKLLFNRLSTTPWLFVFDNVDHYIEPESAKATMAIHELIFNALKCSDIHSSRFIFTCRPNVDYEHEKFLQIKLPGFSITKSEELFVARGVDVDDAVRQEIRLIHDATDGHPLWLTLIATQVAKSRAQLQKLSAQIQRGKVAGLPRAMLRSIWETLNEKQQFILRYMAELIRPEREDRVGSYVSSKLTWNQFSRQLKSLKTLNLVVVKSSDGVEKIDLHPLIREFIRQEYTALDRREFIHPIVKFFDTIIIHLRPKKAQSISANNIENWIVRAELQVNMGECERAIDTIIEVQESMFSYGFREEFIRIADKIMTELDWSSPMVQGAKCLQFLFTTAESLMELGRFVEADSLLNRIEQTLPGKTAAYIGLCSARCYSYWLRENYERAIYWGECGINLQKSGITTSFDCSNNLALAKRDSGDIDSALTFFLKGYSLVDVLDEKIPVEQISGAFYGNIGRCLFKRGDFVDALTCYSISQANLAAETSSQSLANQGYAHLWIGDALEKQSDWHNAYLFYKRAFYLWSKLKPVKADEPNQKAGLLLKEHPELEDLQNLEEWTVEHQCKQWFKNRKSHRK